MVAAVVSNPNKASFSTPVGNASVPEVSDSVDIVLPPSLFSSGGGECSILVQVEPEDTTILDFEGSSGAIGRFEADDSGVTLDLKGYQYGGSIHPGPTAMVVAFSREGHQLKVDAITDEFVTLTKTQDIMAKLDAVTTGKMDEGFTHREMNANDNTEQNQKKVTGTTATKKETSTSAPQNKKRKITSKKKK